MLISTGLQSSEGCHPKEMWTHTLGVNSFMPRVLNRTVPQKSSYSGPPSPLKHRVPSLKRWVSVAAGDGSHSTLLCPTCWGCKLWPLGRALPGHGSVWAGTAHSPTPHTAGTVWETIKHWQHCTPHRYCRSALSPAGCCPHPSHRSSGRGEGWGCWGLHCCGRTLSLLPQACSGTQQRSSPLGQGSSSPGEPGPRWAGRKDEDRPVCPCAGQPCGRAPWACCPAKASAAAALQPCKDRAWPWKSCPRNADPRGFSHCPRGETGRDKYDGNRPNQEPPSFVGTKKCSPPGNKLLTALPVPLWTICLCKQAAAQLTKSICPSEIEK